MGFKADTSFLRYLTMGAISARQTMSQMRDAGFEPIELERYCTSNKIWSTKVKRLRLPDILCVRTGLRVEVRAKSDLKIRMSDAPSNPGRRWHTGLRDEDLSAFIACFDEGGTPVPAKEAVFFSVEDLKASEDRSRLGPPKSAAEGAERDRTWPAKVPSRSGVVQSVDATSVRVLMTETNSEPPRHQSFRLDGQTAYVRPGEAFVGGASILAGAPATRANLRDYCKNFYDPMNELTSDNSIDRYAAVKALPFRADKKEIALAAIERRLDDEKEKRILLESAGAGLRLGSAKSHDWIDNFVRSYDDADLRMEAVFILTEAKSAGAKSILLDIATRKEFSEDEIRQAAVWGLGKTGLQDYANLIQFLEDPEDDVVLHAIVGFGANTPKPVIERLIRKISSASQRGKASASDALRRIGSETALSGLIESVRSASAHSEWILATIGRFPENKVRQMLEGDPLLALVEPLLLLSGPSNWLSKESVDADAKFLTLLYH